MSQKVKIDMQWPLYFKDRFAKASTKKIHVLPNSREQRAYLLRAYPNTPQDAEKNYFDEAKCTMCWTNQQALQNSYVSEAEFLANPCGTCLAYYYKAKAENTFVL